MEPFSILSGVAVPLDEANLDTNQLCPSRFNKVPKGPRYAQILLHDRRFNADGSEKPDYILNQEQYRHAVIAVAARNFGVGSSRETAVFGLIGFGIRCVIAPNFGDIFFNNSLKNGLLPVRLPAATVETLMPITAAELARLPPEQRRVALEGTAADDLAAAVPRRTRRDRPRQ